MRNFWIIPEGTSAGVTVKANADGSFDITGTSTDEAGISKSIYTLEEGKTYTVSTNKLVSQNGSSSEGCLAVQFYKDGARKAFKNFGYSEATKTASITAPSDFDYATCMVYTGAAGNEFDLTGVKVMLNEGSSAGEWVPSGDLPPADSGYMLKIGSMSLADFGQCIASRNIGAPEKKLVTKTVPHMSGFFDFSKIYGALAYESRELEYEIQMIGESREDLQQQRSDLMTWLSTVHDQDIFDEDVPGWHFRGSLESIDWEEGESGESGTLTVTFLCHPFMIRNEESSQTIAVGSGVIENEGMAVNPCASVASGTGTIKIGNVTQSVGTSPVRLTAQLQPGSNQVEVTGASVTVTWHEERV